MQRLALENKSLASPALNRASNSNSQSKIVFSAMTPTPFLRYLTEPYYLR